MREHPVFQEAVQIFYVEGHGFPAYFCILAVLAPVEFFALAIPALDVQIWTGSANLFKVCSVTTLLLIVYFAMRVADQEFAAWRFQPLKRWLRDEKLPALSVGAAQIAFLLLHLLVSLAICVPLLVWAAAIARTQPAAVAATFFLLLFYAVSYSVWGLVALVVWERRAENRQVAVRCFFFTLVILSALLYLPLNPVAYLLSYLGREELAPLRLGAWQWSSTIVHFAFHLTLLGTGVAAHFWALRRGETA